MTFNPRNRMVLSRHETVPNVSAMKKNTLPIVCGSMSGAQQYEIRPAER